MGVDVLFQLRPDEPTDARIVIVGLTNEDMRSLGDSRLSDAQIAQLIKIIKQGKPRVIGLDIFRDHPVKTGYEELMEVFRTTPHLYGIGKQTGIKGDPDYDTIDPPPIPQAQIADVSVALDGDNVQRRGFLYPITQTQIVPSLGMALALEYLKNKGIEPYKDERSGMLALGEVIFHRFRHQSGPYVKTGDGSYQIFMNWRKAPFRTVSVVEVLHRQIPPSIFANKIVFIGGHAPKLGDQFLTPFSRGITSTPRQIYGVEAQAQLTSTVISAVLDRRPLVKVWYEPWISLAIVLCGITTFIAIERNQSRWYISLLFLLLTSSGLCAIAYAAFLQAAWLPLVPCLLSIWSQGIFWLLFKAYESIDSLNKKLAEKLDKRQIYREITAQLQYVSTSIASDLESLLDSILILNQQANLLAEMNVGSANINPQEKNKMSLYQLSVLTQNIVDRSELICFKLLKVLPNPDPLLRLKAQLEIKNDHQNLPAAITIALSPLRYIYYQEYKVDLNEFIKINGDDTLFTAKVYSISKWIALLNYIFDSVFLFCYLHDARFPQLQIDVQRKANIEMVTITIDKQYYPRELSLFWCEEIVKYYGGNVNFKTRQEKSIWTLSFPKNMGNRG